MARRRTRRGNRPKGPAWPRVIGLLMLIAVGGFTGGYLWLRSYLHSEGFRHFLEAKTAAPLKATASYTPFKWDGLQVSSETFSAQGENVVKNLRANGLQTEIGLGGVSRGAWELKTTTISRLSLELDTTQAGAPPAPPSQPATAATAEKPSWLAGLIPHKVELSSLRIDEAALRVTIPSGQLRATGQRWLIEPDAPGTFRLEATGGRFSAPWPLMTDAKLNRATLLSRPGRLYLTDSEFLVGERARLSASGEIGFDDGSYGFEGSLRDLKVQEVLPADWKKRLTGDLHAKFSVRPGSNGSVTRGQLELKNGILTALPLLDQLAAYADVARFRTLNLRDARLNFTRQGEQITLTDIVIGSEALVQLEGRMTIDGSNIDGSFRLGITPGTLARIPGAETKVFLPGERGLLWAPIRVTGTLDQPKEDLTERLILAAGERMFEIVPETGQKVLKFAGTAASEGTLNLIKQSSEILKSGGQILNGSDNPIQKVGEGLFNLIPGIGN